MLKKLLIAGSFANNSAFATLALAAATYGYNLIDYQTMHFMQIAAAVLLLTDLIIRLSLETYEEKRYLKACKETFLRDYALTPKQEEKIKKSFAPPEKFSLTGRKAYFACGFTLMYGMACFSPQIMHWAGSTCTTVLLSCILPVLLLDALLISKQILTKLKINLKQWQDTGKRSFFDRPRGAFPSNETYLESILNSYTHPIKMTLRDAVSFKSMFMGTFRHKSQLEIKEPERPGNDDADLTQYYTDKLAVHQANNAPQSKKMKQTLMDKTIQYIEDKIKIQVLASIIISLLLYWRYHPTWLSSLSSPVSAMIRPLLFIITPLALLTTIIFTKYSDDSQPPVIEEKHGFPYECFTNSPNIFCVDYTSKENNPIFPFKNIQEIPMAILAKDPIFKGKMIEWFENTDAGRDFAGQLAIPAYIFLNEAGAEESKEITIATVIQSIAPVVVEADGNENPAVAPAAMPAVAAAAVAAAAAAGGIELLIRLLVAVPNTAADGEGVELVPLTTHHQHTA
jgi:hypothetical protein